MPTDELRRPALCVFGCEVGEVGWGAKLGEGIHLKDLCCVIECIEIEDEEVDGEQEE